MSSQAKGDPTTPTAEKTGKGLSERLRIEEDGSISADAEKAFQELSQSLECREQITKEDVKWSRKLILDECNEGAHDQVIGACSGVKRKLKAASFYGQDSALARLIVMLSEGAAHYAERALSLDVAGREIELALASRLALTVSTLSEALDRHRSRRPSE